MGRKADHSPPSSAEVKNEWGWGAQIPGPGRRETEFCIVVSNIFGASVWNVLHATFLAPGIFRWLLDF